MSKTLKLTALAQYVGVSRRTFYVMIQDGRFPVLPIPGTSPRLWDVDAVDAWRSSAQQPSAVSAAQ